MYSYTDKPKSKKVKMWNRPPATLLRDKIRKENALKALKLYAEGRTYAEIAVMLGCGTSSSSGQALVREGHQHVNAEEFYKKHPDHIYTKTASLSVRARNIVANADVEDMDQLLEKWESGKLQTSRNYGSGTDWEIRNLLATYFPEKAAFLTIGAPDYQI